MWLPCKRCLYCMYCVPVVRPWSRLNVRCSEHKCVQPFCSGTFCSGTVCLLFVVFTETESQLTKVQSKRKEADTDFMLIIFMTWESQQLVTCNSVTLWWEKTSGDKHLKLCNPPTTIHQFFKSSLNYIFLYIIMGECARCCWQTHTDLSPNSAKIVKLF